MLWRTEKRNSFYFGRNAGLNPLFNVPSPRPVTRRDGHRPSWLFLLSELNAAWGVFVLPKQVGSCFEEPKSVTLFYFGRNAGLNPLFNVPSTQPVTRRDGHFMYSCPLCICAKPARSQLYVMSKRCR